MPASPAQLSWCIQGTECSCPFHARRGTRRTYSPTVKIFPLTIQDPDLFHQWPKDKRPLCSGLRRRTSLTPRAWVWQISLATAREQRRAKRAGFLLEAITTSPSLQRSRRGTLNHISKQTHLNNSATIKVGIFSFYTTCGSFGGEEQKTVKVTSAP